MNLISGRLMDRQQSLAYLERLNELTGVAYQKEALTAEKVMAACEAFSRKLNEAEHLPLLLSLGLNEEKALRELRLVKQMMSREYLEKRLDIEFGKARNSEFTPFGSKKTVRQEWKPLGTLLHIAAGNVDVLPVFSVIEGLLTGNINILKLPESNDGLSTYILQELIDLEPMLADYIFVFDYRSEDIDSIKKMAEPADAIVVWGGDAAIGAVRKMAAPDTKIIEWGHKLSFAYVSGSDIPQEALEGLAYNICDTNQLFCNSCQGIFLDTDDFNSVLDFAEKFVKILDNTARAMSYEKGPFLSAQKTLELYTEELESIKTPKRVFRTANCGVIAYDDHTLVPSYMFRNCWIKPLIKDRLLHELRKYKNHMQTVALICEKSERSNLETILVKTGVVRITDGKNMSAGYCGMPHDGEFPLRRYMKLVSYEY